MNVGDLVRETSCIVPSYQKAPYYAIVTALQGDIVHIVWIDTLEPDTSDKEFLEVVSENR